MWGRKPSPVFNTNGEEMNIVEMYKVAGLEAAGKFVKQVGSMAARKPEVTGVIAGGLAGAVEGGTGEKGSLGKAVSHGLLGAVGGAAMGAGVRQGGGLMKRVRNTQMGLATK